MFSILWFWKFGKIFQIYTKKSNSKTFVATVQKSASPQNTSHNGLAWLQRQAIAQMSKKEFQAFFFVLSSLSHPQFLVFLGAIILLDLYHLLWASSKFELLWVVHVC